MADTYHELGVMQYTWGHHVRPHTHNPALVPSMLRALIAVGLLQSDALQSFKLAVHLDPTHPHAASNIKVTLAHVLSMLRPPPVSSPTLNYYPCCVLPLVYPFSLP